MDNENLVRNFIDVIWNKHQLNQINEFCSKDAVIISPHGEITGLEKIKKYVNAILVGFPDIAYTILDIFSAENKVIVRWEGKGTHKGIFSGNAPTNKKMTYEGINVYEIENNKIKETWVNADLYGLLKQLGVIHIPSHR